MDKHSTDSALHQDRFVINRYFSRRLAITVSIAFLFFAFTSPLVHAEEQKHFPRTSGELRDVLKLMVDRADSGKDVEWTGKQHDDVVWSVGFVEGISEGIRIAAYTDHKDISCMDHMKGITTFRAVVDYVDTHAEIRSEPSMAAVAQTIYQNYACILKPATKTS